MSNHANPAVCLLCRVIPNVRPTYYFCPHKFVKEHWIIEHQCDRTRPPTYKITIGAYKTYTGVVKAWNRLMEK